MNRVLSSPSKQKALVQLMSSDPSLLNGLDDDLLASITLSDPPKKSLEQRPERKTIQLYPEDASFIEKKTSKRVPVAINCGKRPSLTRATTVLLSPSSNAQAVAATVSSRQNGPGWTRRTTIQRPAMVLYDESMLQSNKGGSTKKRAKRMRRRRRKGSTSGSDSSTNNSEEENSQQEFTSVTHDSVESDSDEGTQVVRSYAVEASHLLLDHHHFVSREQLIPRSSRKACYVCMREFNVLRKRHSCRMCGEVICSRCSVFRQVNLPVLEKKFRICSCCFVAYRKKLEETEKPQEEEESSDPVSDGSDHRDSARGGSITEVSAPPSSGTFLFHPPASLSSESNSDRSSQNTMNTMSDFSFSSDTLYDMSAFLPGSLSVSRNMEDELEAVLKAKQLEKEVEASQQRIHDLEAQIASQESQQDLLSAEQQLQLKDARATIKLLQDQLRTQEMSARQAAHNRDSICLSKLRQTELYANEDDESNALKKKLKVLERQLKQAGISVAEVIPYELAKRKVAEISKRLQEIGSSEIVLEDKQAQAAARKEYYILEQEMEKYHMALVMTDEYIEEQRRQEQEWEDANQAANRKALRQLRSTIPVDISRLSERELIEFKTPTGIKFPAELARRLKRTNVLQLLRTDPKTIVKMHPSVIEGYRTTGITLLERRALHAVMKEPCRVWKKQQNDEMAQKKYAWYCKLKEAFVTAATNLQSHCKVTTGSDVDPAQHSCELLGLACPVRAEERVRKLYCNLGFTPEAEFVQEEILKSDPEGAGEKALLEAQAHAREMVANQRQRDLKAHYRMNMREVAQAVGALEEMDSVLDQVRVLDASFPVLDELEVSQCNALLNSVRELLLLFAKRAGICITGKRDSAKDEEDTRSPVEIREVSRAIIFLQEVLVDVKELLFKEDGMLRGNKSVTAAATFKAVQELLDDVVQKNSAALDEPQEIQSTRVSWRKRTNTPQPLSSENLSQPVQNQPPAPPSALLFDAIKARRKHNGKRVSESKRGSTHEAQKANKPLDLMAAIRARKPVQSNSEEP
ncbi:1-phosphatidylinositol 3-phosphate 5-kinase FAB1 [Phytophthora citrophthora]|uniref:1-phosphatidylinositol 3-phosphate 5-kinase FAB1 n=1 Tax=Phytophthora citrophthora TaxID=4793 RepID=A0AAD9GB06_9STRA|nr:1-phosphatidylinositol 3-phosphate 5-kinase FAB1 [Phytophthora citrophthora]